MSRNMIPKALAIAVKESNNDINVSVDDVKVICETLFVYILDQVKGGKDVTITNFLKFKRNLNKARTFRKPKSEETTSKPERYSLSVKIMANTKTAFEQIPVASDVSEEAVSESEDVESEDVPVKVAKPVKPKAAKVKKAVVASDTEVTSEVEVEAEKPPKKKVAAVKKSDTESDSDGKKEKVKAAPKGKAAAKKAVGSDSEAPAKGGKTDFHFEDEDEE